MRRKSLSPGLSGSPGSPAGSTGSTESGREVKRRRLDELLNKKFEKVGGSLKPEAGTIKPGSPTQDSLSADPLTNSQMERRDSQVYLVFQKVFFFIK